MAVTDVLSGPLPESAHRSQLRRAIIASTVGTTIEWYDFLLYSVVTGLAFGKLFFPKSDPLVGVLEAFAIYAVGFIARPMGAAIFGHYGDRVGRKAVLIATLLITGLATFAVGLVPTYASIGIWGAVVLTTIRFIQGIGVGGEWGGSVLLSMEWARTSSHRGFIAAWPRSLVHRLDCCWLMWRSWSSVGFRATNSWFGDGAYRFLLSIVMAGVGLYIPLGILENAPFRRLVAEKRIEQVPVLEVIRRQPKEIILCALAKTAEIAPAYIYLAFVFAYGLQVLHVSRDFLLLAVIAGCLLSLVVIPLSGYLSDRIGRQAHVPARRDCDGDFRFHLFRHAELSGAGLDLPRHHALLRDARHSLWAAGSVDSRVLHPAASLQRLLDRLSSRRYYRRRPRAPNRHGTASMDRVGVCLIAGYIAACAVVRHYRDHANAARSHEPRHLARAR